MSTGQRPETLVEGDAAAQQDSEDTIRRSPQAPDRNVELKVQVGFVCPTCWQVHPGGDPGECPTCRSARPDDAWPQMPLVFRGRYRFVRLLGRGGQGAVFLAEDQLGDLDEGGRRPIVAVKVIQRIGDPAAARRMTDLFEHEVAVAPLLGRSPYFVRTYGYEIGADPYLAMEFVQWTTLKKHLKAGRIAMVGVARLGVALLEALEVMHFFRVVHRDLKPSNIFVREAGKGYRVKLADLGIWCRDHEAGSAGALAEEKQMLCGTLGYMSPEQMRCEHVGARSDIHSMGSILWLAFTGSLPYRPAGENLRVQLHSRQTACDRPPLRPDDMPDALYKLLCKAMAPNTGERFASAREMADALRELVRRVGRDRGQHEDDIEHQLEVVLQRIEQLRALPGQRSHLTRRLERIEQSVTSFRDYLQSGGQMDLGVFEQAVSETRAKLAAIAEELDDPYARQRESVAEGKSEVLPALDPAAVVAAAQAPEPTTSVLARYQQLELVGAGSLGRIYNGRHRKLHKRVAIKEMNHSPAPGLTDEQHRRLFDAQARAASQLEHPNAMQVTDYDVSPDGVPFIVMEYMDGDTLADLLKARGAFPQRIALANLTPVLGALMEAHGLDIIHSNLKSSRVILKRVPGFGDIPNLIGFGLHVDELDDLIPKGMLLGTPRYMAPELVRGGPPSKSADLYAFGTLLHIALVGAAPFRGALKAMMSAKINAEPPLLPEVGPCGPISRELAAVVVSLLQRDHARRPESAEQVRSWLNALLRGQPQAVPTTELMARCRWSGAVKGGSRASR